MKRWGGIGAFRCGFWGLLFGGAFFAIPGIGPILIAGPLVAWIIGGLECEVVVGGAREPLKNAELGGSLTVLSRHGLGIGDFRPLRDSFLSA
jgi:hypothetical protein